MWTNAAGKKRVQKHVFLRNFILYNLISLCVHCNIKEKRFSTFLVLTNS